MVTAESPVMEAPSASSAKAPADKSAVRPLTAPMPSVAVPAAPKAPASNILVEIEYVDFLYGASNALHDNNLKIEDHKVTAFIGTSG